MKVANILDLKVENGRDDVIYEAGDSANAVVSGPRLSDDAPLWAKRRWKELVEERKAYTAHEMASKLSLCPGFNRDKWIMEG